MSRLATQLRRTVPAGVAAAGAATENRAASSCSMTRSCSKTGTRRGAIGRASLRTSYAQSKRVLRLHDLPAGRCGTSPVPSKQVLCPHDRRVTP